MTSKFQIPVSLLSPRVDAKKLGFANTSEITPLEEPIGQARAVEALEFGFSMQSPGFNIYAAGPIGTGKWSIVRRMVAKKARSGASPPDWCYVNNFQDPSQPRCISFPAGQARPFKVAMEVFVKALRHDMRTAFESSKYLDARAKVMEEFDSKKKALFHEVNEVARERSFGFQEDPVGFSLVPMKEGRAIKEEEVRKLTEAERQAIGERRRHVEGKIREFQSQVHTLDHEAEHALRDMDRQVVQSLLSRRLDPLREAYDRSPDVLNYLQEIEADVVANYRDFIQKEVQIPLLGFTGGHQADLSRYDVNLIAEHKPDEGAPVVDESHPTYPNLIGKIERRSHLGVVFTNFTEIKAGACVQASGGYLVLNAMDLLRQPFAWDALKRVVKTREVKIEDPGEFFGFSTTGLKPQPVPVDLKVVLLGPPFLYHLLQAYEEDFSKLFKVKADFDVDLKRTEEEDQRYARFIAGICQEERLPHFDAGAVAEVIHQGLRMADRYDRLSLRLSLLTDLIREAAFWARKEGHTVVTGGDVETAIAKKRFRASLPEEWVQEEIKEGTLIVDVEGETIGQVNGLSVHLLGESTFGRPCRITARTFVGTKGVIDIQREAALAGQVHSKGVLTLGGYLAGRFAGSHPFALSATVTFEQTYSEVEGDSAAAAEIAALVSSLAGVPIRQSLAITGSVNQLGEIQPIGGVNEKIEGFFETCNKHGLAGNQGVIIPARNSKHLALRPEVVQAVEAGRFAVYGVNTVEEALELLTGIPTGERDANGDYPEGTLYHRVSERLAQMAAIVSDWMERSEIGEDANSEA